MLAALRYRVFHRFSSRSTLPSQQQHAISSSSGNPGFLNVSHHYSSSVINDSKTGFLDLEEVEKVLSDVRADNVQVIPVKKGCDWADFMVIATGRSTWHVKNIAQALIYKAKQKQKGVERVVLPSVEGQEGGKWIVIDSGKVIIHALDENARAYYNLESLWTAASSPKESVQDLEKAFTKIRPKNNSKKRVPAASLPHHEQDMCGTRSRGCKR